MFPRERVQLTCGSPLLARYFLHVARRVPQILDPYANHVTDLLSCKVVVVGRY